MDKERPNPAEEYMAKIENEPEKTEPEQSPITAKAFEQRKPVFDPTGRVEDMDPDEIKIADVRRHPIGLIFILFQFIVGFGAAFVLTWVLLPDFGEIVGLSRSSSAALAVALMFAILVLGLIFLFLAIRIYRGNQLIISDQNITQVLQETIFNRKVSELTMGNVEDVTAHQNGVFPTIFNYGDLVIETAGEQKNFRFIYCPNPNAYAKAIQDARAVYLKKHSHGDNE